MANPYDIPYVVTEGESPLTYNRHCYLAGDTIMVKQNDIGCFMEDVLPEPPLDKCFPEYCVGDKGYDATKDHRVPVLVPAGATVIQPVAALEGCRPPSMVCFHYCANCLYVGYDAEPLIDPEDPLAASGGGADPNPTCRELDCIENLHIHNPGASDVLVTLSYYC